MLEIVGYADRHSVRPGERLKIMVSCEAGAKRFRAQLARLICGDDSPIGPGYKEQPIANAANGDYPGRRQTIEVGSSVVVPPSPHFDALRSFSLQAFVWPTLPGRGRQTILSLWSEPGRTGLALAMDDDGGLALRLGDGTHEEIVRVGAPMIGREWYFVAASFDADSRRVELYQEPLARRARDGSAALKQATVSLTPKMPQGASFLMAAHGAGQPDSPLMAGHFNGKIEAPRLASRALTRAEMEALKQGVPAALDGSTVGAWDFARDIPTDRIHDLSANRLDGVAVNLPTRAMKGHNWTGEVFAWTQAPEQYAAIHFHDDDLYDAGWQPDFEIALPDDLKSGIYAVRLSCGERHEQQAFVSFFVRPPKGRTTAPVAFLASTATYIAYANSHHGWDDPLSEICYGALIDLGPTEMFLDQRPDFGRSTYDIHADGSGSCFSSRLRPILNTRPQHRIWNFGADLHIIDWLEASGQAYDVITDEDLHREGVALLAPYRAIVTGSHPEYHSRVMLDAIEAYLGRGGRLMYLGGNGFYWRIAWHPSKPGVIEIRRGESGTRTWIAEPGEYYLACTGELSGLWRNSGLAPQALVGVGYASEGFDVSSYYRRLPGSFDPRAAFVFEGVGPDERIGDFGSVGGGAAGLELDIADRLLGTPPHALILASSERHSNVYVTTPEELMSAYPGIDGIEDAKVRADLVFFETPGGGGVFSVGSIAWPGSLAHNRYDNNVARITGNVLRRFIDPKPL